MHFIKSPAGYTKRVCSAFCFVILLLASCVNDQELEFNPVLDIPPTCSDGLKNQDETAVDCGGACSNICGETILASCSGELELNEVHSENDEPSLYFSSVLYTRSYGYQNLLQVYAIDEETDDEIRVVLPLTDFPVGNMKFNVAKEVVYSEESRSATVRIIPYYGAEKISVTGTIYVRVEGKEKVHLEFCDMLFQPYYHTGQSWYTYSGNISILLSDSEF